MDNPTAYHGKSRIPVLKDYGISELTGFLPSPSPLTRLPLYFEPWEKLLDDLSHYLVAWKLREMVSRLPVLESSNLQSEAEFQRAFLVLSLLSHAYVWGAKGQPVLDILPACLSMPWLGVSLNLGLRPISCHAALVYFNYKVLDNSLPIDLSNLATLHTISGGIDESWFYLITVAIEAQGAPALTAIISALQASENHNIQTIISSLKTISESIEQITKTLMRMPENCDPYIFYHRVRIYFSGWSNMKDLPSGLTYEGDQNQIEKMFVEEGEHEALLNPSFNLSVHSPKRYPGGSAAQSSLIHALDVFFGIHHYPTGDKAPNDAKINFLNDMRYHMPRKYRHFLKDLQNAPSLQTYLSASSPTHVDPEHMEEAKSLFNLCVSKLKTFRDKHIQIVTRYIVIQARRAAEVGQEEVEGTGYHGMGPSAHKIINISPESPTISTRPDDLVSNDGLNPIVERKLKAVSESRGTGGTDIMPFLKQSRDETYAARIPQ